MRGTRRGLGENVQVGVQVGVQVVKVTDYVLVDVLVKCIGQSHFSLIRACNAHASR